MRLLSRKFGETIVVCGRVRVTVTKVRGQGVSLGIAVPLNIGIDRNEVFARKETGVASPDENGGWQNTSPACRGLEGRREDVIDERQAEDIARC